MPRQDKLWVDEELQYFQGAPLADYEKYWLRRLTHLYRHQIAAMRKNRGKA
jgi:hypothetical protein